MPPDLRSMIALRRRVLQALSLVLAACASSPEAKPPPRAPQPVAEPEPEPEEEEPEPEPKPQVVIRRYHVYGRVKTRWRETIRIRCLLQTSRTEKLEIGTEALLQREVEDPGPDELEWTPVANVRVTKLGKNGHARLEIVAEHPEAKKKGKASPWQPGTRIRLQVERREETGG